jgi:hypothetical protein
LLPMLSAALLPGDDGSSIIVLCTRGLSYGSLSAMRCGRKQPDSIGRRCQQSAGCRPQRQLPTTRFIDPPGRTRELGIRS